MTIAKQYIKFTRTVTFIMIKKKRIETKWKTK